MKGKVVLIQPKNTLSINIYPPLNLIKLGSVLQREGYKVKIMAAPTIKRPIEMIMEECQDAMMVGIGVLTAEMPSAIRIAKSIKEKYQLPIVWGGWHATLFPEQMAASNIVDKVVVDEGDELIIEIADSYKDNEYNKEINNGEKILRNRNKLNMELLPVPDYRLVSNIEHYINLPLTDKFVEYEDRAIRWLPYEASRGCPSKCSFCINVVTGNRMYRRKSARKVVDEIESIVEKFDINHLKIIDDNFFVNVEWVKEIAKGIIDRNLGISWDGECRVNYFNDKHVNDECLELCVRSGLNELNFGIESGSQRSLDIMKKEITPSQSLSTVSISSKHGIVSRCSFIIDVPGEKKEDIFKTVQLINKIRVIPKTTCGVHTYRPYPKSELCEELLARGVISQPTTLEGWEKKEFVEQFTYTDARRKWQKNYNISNKISFYQCLESGFWLKPHQIHNSFISKINSFFMKIASLRNLTVFYRFTIDRYLYVLFRNLFYKFQEWR